MLALSPFPMDFYSPSDVNGGTSNAEHDTSVPGKATMAATGGLKVLNLIEGEIGGEMRNLPGVDLDMTTPTEPQQDQD